MTTSQKIKKAVEMVQVEKDGCTYLQLVCGIKELVGALETATDDDVMEVIRDAITLKRYKSSSKV